MLQYQTANELLNAAAAEVGIAPRNDPWSANDAALQQMKAMLQTCGDEMLTLYPWEQLTNEHQIITSSADSGDYFLPADYGYMIDQTGWENTNRIPLQGPMSPQEWTYIMGRKLAQHTIYVSFRVAQGVFRIYPRDPVPEGGDVTFEYVSRYWVADSGQFPPATPGEFPGTKSKLETGSDYVLYEPAPIRNYLKAKWLAAKGLDNAAPLAAFRQYLDNWIGQNSPNRVLSTANTRNQFPFLNPTNLPDTGYGR